MDNFRKFEAAGYLDSEEAIAEYLTAALEDENPDVFLVALRDVAKARGMSAVAQGACLKLAGGSAVAGGGSTGREVGDV
jgi:probable addiction module antidote protein